MAERILVIEDDPSILRGLQLNLGMEGYVVRSAIDGETGLVLARTDVARALTLALRPGLRGVFNVTGPGEVPLSAIFRELGRSPIPIPHPLARPLVRRAFDARLSSFPPEEVDHIQYLCVVDGSRFAREAGWAPAFSLKDTIRSVA